MPRLICGDQSAACASSRPAARRGHRLLQQLLVELDADLADMAGLLLAQKVAGAADVEVVAGELEAGAQRVEGLHDLEPLGRRLVQRLARRHGEIGIGPRLAAADAAAQLVELGQAEHVGAVDDHGVGVPDVEARFRRCWSTAARRTCRRRSPAWCSRWPSAAAGHAPWPCGSPAPARAGRRPPPPGPRCAGRHRSSGRRDTARAAAPRGWSRRRTA